MSAYILSVPNHNFTVSYEVKQFQLLFLYETKIQLIFIVLTYVYELFERFETYNMYADIFPSFVSSIVW